MRILYISNLFPHPIAPNMAPFNRQQLVALSNYCNIDVVSPVPWPIGLRNRKRLTPRTENEIIRVYHPIYYYTPRILRIYYGNFFYASIKTTVTRLLTDNHYDLIFSSWLYPDAWAAAQLARKNKIPLIVKVHGSDVNRLNPDSALTIKSLWVVQQAHKVVCVSKALRQRLLCLGAPEDKLEVIYNGIDNKIFYPMDLQALRRQLKVAHDVFVVLFVGNLKKEKGLGELVAAFKQLQVEGKRKQDKLVIIGSGSFRAELEQQIGKFGLHHQVQLLGSKSHAEIARWMNAASVLCLPSYMEGVPNVVLEALACGTPVVSTNVGGIPELIETSEGLLTIIQPQSVTQLIKAIDAIRSASRHVVGRPRISSWAENAHAVIRLMEYMKEDGDQME